jgi:hypothetical protein
MLHQMIIETKRQEHGFHEEREAIPVASCMLGRICREQGNAGPVFGMGRNEWRALEDSNL